jgi:hypothetical protein
LIGKKPVYEISSEDGILRVDFLRSPEREDLVALMDEMESMEHCALRLYVVIKAEILLSTAIVRQAAEDAQAYSHQPSKIAVVAPGSISYGISRIYKVFRETDETEFDVFRDLDEARAWLKS